MRTRLMLAILPCFALSSFVLAQTATGVIRGAVQDPTGAVIVDANVILIDEATNQVREQNTNGEGIFEFEALPSGNYKVEVEHPRFKKEIIENVPLQVVQTESLTVTLQVGSAKQSIVIQADSGLLEASDASLSQVIDDKARQLHFAPGAILAIDHGYADYQWFARLSTEGVYFVTRLKDNADYAVVEERELPQRKGLRRDPSATN